MPPRAPPRTTATFRRITRRCLTRRSRPSCNSRCAAGVDDAAIPSATSVQARRGPARGLPAPGVVIVTPSGLSANRQLRRDPPLEVVFRSWRAEDCPHLRIAHLCGVMGRLSGHGRHLTVTLPRSRALLSAPFRARAPELVNQERRAPGGSAASLSSEVFAHAEHRVATGSGPRGPRNLSAISPASFLPTVIFFSLRLDLLSLHLAHPVFHPDATVPRLARRRPGSVAYRQQAASASFWLTSMAIWMVRVMCSVRVAKRSSSCAWVCGHFQSRRVTLERGAHVAGPSAIITPGTSPRRDASETIS